MLNRVTLNTLFQLIARGVELASALWVNAWIARQWGVSIFGQIGFVSSLVGIGSFLFSGGCEVLLVRLIAREKEKARHYLLHALALVIPLSLVGTVSILFLGARLSPGLSLAVLFLACLQLAFSTISLLLQACFFAYERMEWEGVLALSDRGIWIGLGFWLACRPPSLVAMFAALALCKGLKLLLGCLLFYQIIWPQAAPARLDIRELLRILRQAFPFGLELLFSTIYASADVLLLARWTGEGEAGLYRAASMLIAPLVLLAVAFNNALYPRLSIQAQSRPDQVSASGRLSIRLILMGAVPLTVFLFLFAPFLVHLLFGPRYEASIPLLRCLSLVIPFRFLNNSLTTILWATDRQGAQMKCEGLAAACSLFLNSLLIPSLGGLGACVALLSTDLLRTAVLVGCLRGFGWQGRDGWVPLACFLLAGAMVLPFASFPWVAVGSLLFLYPTSILGFQLLDREDFRLLQVPGAFLSRSTEIPE